MRFEIPCVLAFACTVLAGENPWFLERFRSPDCSASDPDDQYSPAIDPPDQCRPMYNQSTDPGPNPSIRSIRLTWPGDQKARVYWDGDRCHPGSYTEVKNGECTEGVPNLRGSGGDWKNFESWKFI